MPTPDVTTPVTTAEVQAMTVELVEGNFRLGSILRRLEEERKTQRREHLTLVKGGDDA